MSKVHIPASVRRIVEARAQGCCEYCRLHEDDTPFTHPLDHLIPIKHGGVTAAHNLALACLDCNSAKGSDLAGLDPLNGQLVPLFNPRAQQWADHFTLSGAYILGLSPIGRVTMVVLRFNDYLRLVQRQTLITIGRYPPAF